MSIWHRLARLLKVLLLLMAVASIIGAFQPLLRTQKNERVKREVLQEQINAQKKLLERNKRQVYWLMNDREYLETIARDKFEGMKEGETIFRLDEPKGKSALTPVLPATPKR